ncbi:Tetratricopeptide repeat protein 25, partial [Bulinus truncatus]
ALQLRPDDRICLVRRSKCHLMLGDTAKALHDAEASLIEDKNYHRGMFQKAEALYNAGDFEMALVYYHRGNRLRPELLEFRLGIQKAREAIINCVGTPDRVKLNTTGDLSFFHAQDEKKKRKVFGSSCVRRPPQVIRRTKEKSNNEMTIRQMLGELYGDRQYLEKLLKETDNTSLTGKRINRLVQEGLSYLDTMTEFWQQVKPMYARKYEAILALNRGRQVKTSPYDHIVGELDKINKLMGEGNYEGVLKKCQRTMVALESIQEIHLPNKMTFKANIHSIMGNAYLEMGDFANAAVQHQMDLTVGEEIGIDDAECRALDNLGRVHARNGKFQKAIDVWERKLPKSKGLLETTWLCHEIGRCYLELGQSRSAKDYGERALVAAEEAGDDRWRLHALVLISQAEVKSERLASSLISFEKAYEVAALLMDDEAQSAIKKAIAEVNLKVIERELEGGEEVDANLLPDIIELKSIAGESLKDDQASVAGDPKMDDVVAETKSHANSAPSDTSGKT